MPLGHLDGKSYLLMNKHGKCLAVETTGIKNPAENGAKLIQANCNPLEKGQLWKWNRKLELLCNEWNKCLSVPFNLNFGSRASFVFHWDLNQSDEVPFKKWVLTFLVIFFFLLNSHVRMYVRCTVKYLFGSFSGSSNLSPKLR